MDANSLYTAAWAAHAEMLNRAQEMEEAAKKLRERAAALHAVLDPPAKEGQR